MTSMNRIVYSATTLSLVVFVTGLLSAFTPRLAQADSKSITLAPGDQLIVNCQTSLNGVVSGTQSTITCASPPTATPTVVSSGPVVTGFNGVQDGQTIKGTVAIEALVTGDNIAQVVFQLDGPKTATHTEQYTPYYFMGDNNGVPNGWDTTQYPDGDYTLKATATNTSGQSNALSVKFHIGNGSQPQSTETPTPTAALTPTSVPPATTTPQSQAGQILWAADHETGDFSQWTGPNANGSYGDDGGIYNSGTGVASITTDVAHSGQYAAKLTISSADGQHGNQGVRLFRTKESRTVPAAYYSVWYYFPQRYTPASWWDLFQFKSVDATHNDAFWQLNGGNRADGSMNFYLVNWVNQKYYYQTVKNIPVGQWTHVEVYYKQSATNTGHITVWQDGVLLFDLDGITTEFADATESANWSVNNYTDNISPSTATIYIDDAVISTKRIGP